MLQASHAKAEEMDYWTYDEYIAFREGIKDNPLSYGTMQIWVDAKDSIEL